MALSQFVILSVLFAAAVAKGVPFRECPGVSHDRCSVTEVHITPCPEKKVCGLVQGSNVTLSFDFTPNFSASNLKTEVNYQGTPFGGVSDNACLYTSCPSVSGVSQTFNYQLYAGKKLPKGKYTIVWKVWDGNNASDVCCFSPTIKIKKGDNSDEVRH